jgi:hypothetical protein
MFFPTWIDMILLLVSFVWSTIQHRSVPEGSSGVLRLVFMAFCVVMMGVVVLYNDVDAWLSTGLFLISAAGLAMTWQFNRLLPSRLPDEPGV